MGTCLWCGGYYVVCSLGLMFPTLVLLLWLLVVNSVAVLDSLDFC